MGSIITIKVYRSRMDAEIAKSLLDSANIQSHISADDEGGMFSFPFGSLGAVGAKLLVNEKDASDAKQILSR